MNLNDQIFSLREVIIRAKRKAKDQISESSSSQSVQQNYSQDNTEQFIHQRKTMTSSTIQYSVQKNRREIQNSETEQSMDKQNMDSNARNIYSERKSKMEQQKLKLIPTKTGLQKQFQLRNKKAQSKFLFQKQVNSPQINSDQQSYHNKESQKLKLKPNPISLSHQSKTQTWRKSTTKVYQRTKQQNQNQFQNHIPQQIKPSNLIIIKTQLFNRQTNKSNLNQIKNIIKQWKSLKTIIA